MRRIRAMGIRDKPIVPSSPWQNGFAERLIGSIRREFVDHFVVLGEAHLRRILQTYARYYNNVRTHRSLDKDAPVSRPIQRTGSIRLHSVLGGLHHHYVRVRFSVHTGICVGSCELALQRHQNAPVIGQRCTAFRSIQRDIAGYPILGGLHHHYVRL